ncbi:hypothetical protein DL766_003915 [Monosporascus sp. MC13-8B]|nr:hypothetical protein DL763_000416 [Monosporascus cannonballus]RYP32590.1 hypothetical protein DL766_003915 [Monosporascus sp. MC13-8B]
MSAAHNFQGSCEMQNPDIAQGKVGELPSTCTAPSATVIPSKRLDDDVQFLSSKPVKRRKISEQKPGPTCQPQFAVSTTPAPLAIPAPAPAPVPVPAVPFPTPTTTQAVNGPREGAHASERRLSTGMVGLPSDMHAVELTYGIRGVSLPVLENFVLNQPPRGPRPMSPPELSPKTLPQTISPAMLSIHTQNTPGEYGLQETPHQEIESCGTSEDIVEHPHDASERATSPAHPTGAMPPTVWAASPASHDGRDPQRPQDTGKLVPDSSAQATETKAQERRSPAPAPAANASNSLKPPASLIQPTYRKRSPNLIVDVAETCQEKFPFEEVAQRHNAPVEKVFDVFAAIIQVPLLRCPTDRRRPGRLATSRIREYTRAKRDIQELRGGARDRGKEEAAAVVTPLDIAHRMGTVAFPEGFTFGNG